MFARFLPRFFSFVHGRPTQAAIGALFLIVVFLMLFTLLPQLTARRIIIGLIAVSLVGSAVLFASMLATCDIGMRPFLAEMILFIFPLEFLVYPPLTAAFVGLILAVAFLLSRIETRLKRNFNIPTTAVSLLSAALLAGAGTYFVTTATGGHPTPGNCVL